MKFIGLIFFLCGLVFLSPLALMLLDAIWWVFNDKTLSGLDWGGLDNPRVPLTFLCSMVATVMFFGGWFFYLNRR